MTRSEIAAIERAAKIIAAALLMQNKPLGRIEAIDMVNAIQQYFKTNDEQG